MYPVKETTGLDTAFGPKNIRDFMPKEADIPKEFYEYNGTKWNKLFSDWFFTGLSSLELTPKEGVDKRKALAHIKTIMVSFEPQHEDKEAACAFLLSEWFEDATWAAKK
jgi:hypothetical protein